MSDVCKCPNCGFVFTPNTPGQPIENHPGVYRHANPWTFNHVGQRIEIQYVTTPTEAKKDK